MWGYTGSGSSMHLLHIECQAARASYACAFLRLGIRRCCGTRELGQGYTVQSGAVVSVQAAQTGPCTPGDKPLPWSNAGYASTGQMEAVCQWFGDEVPTMEDRGVKNKTDGRTASAGCRVPL